MWLTNRTALVCSCDLCQQWCLFHSFIVHAWAFDVKGALCHFKRPLLDRKLIIIVMKTSLSPVQASLLLKVIRLPCKWPYKEKEQSSSVLAGGRAYFWAWKTWTGAWNKEAKQIKKMTICGASDWKVSGEKNNSLEQGHWYSPVHVIARTTVRAVLLY